MYTYEERHGLPAIIGQMGNLTQMTLENYQALAHGFIKDRVSKLIFKGDKHTSNIAQEVIVDYVASNILTGLLQYEERLLQGPE